MPKGVAGPDLASLHAAAPTPLLALKGLPEIEAGAMRLGFATRKGQPPVVGVSGHLAEGMVPDPHAEPIPGSRR